MLNLPLNPTFQEVLEPLGSNAANFFLAASLYHAKVVSFAKAAELAGLSWQEFLRRLQEHFQIGYLLADQVVLEDLETVANLVRKSPP